RRLPRLFQLCARTGRPLGHVPVARPRPQGTQRDGHLVAPPRRVRGLSDAMVVVTQRIRCRTRRTTKDPTKGEAMTKHRTRTREEWLAARLELLGAEKELTRHGDELARRRQELPWVRIDKAYRFETDEGSASLAALFRGRSQLLVYHFMFGPDFTAGCPSCSA